MKDRPKIDWCFEGNDINLRTVEELDNWAEEAEKQIEELKDRRSKWKVLKSREQQINKLLDLLEKNGIHVPYELKNKH